MIRVLSFCLAAGMFVSGTASAGVILHEELSTDERPAQRLRPVRRPIRKPLAAASLHPY